MSKRLQMLEKMTEEGSSDAFAWYALALEYKSLDRTDDALGTFERLRTLFPDYLPMYLMAGQLLIDLDRPTDARPWLEQGLELAREEGDGKAVSEIEAALEEC